MSHILWGIAWLRESLLTVSGLSGKKQELLLLQILFHYYLPNPVIRIVIFILSYSVNASNYAAESLNSYNILELDLPREKEPLLLYRS